MKLLAAGASVLTLISVLGSPIPTVAVAQVGSGFDRENNPNSASHASSNEAQSRARSAMRDGSQGSAGAISLTAQEPVGAEPTAAELETMASAIRCVLGVHDVHGSTHVAGTINGVASISCNGPAASMTLHYSLIRLSPYAQWAGPSVTKSGVTTVSTNRAVSCSEGRANFRGWAQGKITPPPGYTLEGGTTYSAYGNTRYVECSGYTGPYSESPNQGTFESAVTLTFTRNDLVGNVFPVEY